MTQMKHIALALTSLVFVPSICLAQSYNSNDIGVAIMNLNAATLKGKSHSTNDIWERIREDFRLTEVNPELVRQQEQFYANRADYLNRIVHRSQPYIYHIVTEAEKRQIPAEVALLPFIESAFVNTAKSRVGASGLWQFMPASGRQYGLEQNNLYDGRHDVYAATNAALNYLQYLHSLFGDWSLALAAYNWGEGNIGKAIKRAQLSGLEPTYENLRLPNETRNYVPKLLAVRNIIENPHAFGIQLNSVPNKPYFQAVNIDQPIDIRSAAQLANIPIAEFLALNPSFKSPVFIPKPNRKMLLPISAVKTFERNYRKADKDSLLSWNIYTVAEPIKIMDLAEQFGMNISDLKRLNNLSSNTIPAGRSLLLSKNSAFSNNSASDSSALTDLINQRNNAGVTNLSMPVDSSINIATNTEQMPVSGITVPAAPEIITVAATDTSSEPYLMKVAMTGSQPAAPTAIFQTTHELKPTPKSLVASAKIESASTRTSTATRSSKNESSTTHKVAKGDTLFSIAQRYHLNVADLVTANNLRGHNIRTGQVLTVAVNNNVNKNKKATQQVASRHGRSKTTIIPASYTIKKGDTLVGIAQQFNIPVKKLQKVHGNRILRPGQKIKMTGL